MAKVKSTVKLYPQVIKRLTAAQIASLVQTAEAVHTDVVQAQVMPRDDGTLQDDNTFVDKSKSSSGRVSIVSSTPYARRLYFHPEYNFSKTENPNAQGKWYEPWVTGDKKDFAKKTYAKLYKKNGGV